MFPNFIEVEPLPDYRLFLKFDDDMTGVADVSHLAGRNRSLAVTRELQRVAVANENVFEALMEGVKVCSLGEITHALFEVGGQYRRNM